MHSTTARNLTSESMDLIGRCGLRLSSQRIAVASYILSHRTHPTADEIFNALKPDHPTLSRTTVYNTLRALVENGAVKELSIDPGLSRFDATTEPHTHFRCTCCKRIFDLEMASPATPDGFKVYEIQVYMTGICPDCRRLQLNCIQS